MTPTQPNPRERNVEWYRPDPRGLHPAWWIGLCLIFMGFMLSGLGIWRLFTAERPLDVLITGLGVALVAAGLLLPVTRLIRHLADEHYVALRTEGLLHQCKATGARFVPWARIDRVEVQAAELWVHTDDEALGTLRIDVSRLPVAPQVLADRVVALRRRALMGLLG